MNLDTFWGVVAVLTLTWILGIAIILGITLPLPLSTLTLITDNPYLHTAVLLFAFVVSFPVALYFFRKNTTNKKSLAKRLALFLLISYGLNVLLNYRDLTTLFLAILFPVLAYFLTLLIAIERTVPVVTK